MGSTTNTRAPMTDEELHELRRQAVLDLIATRFGTRARFADHVGLKRSYVTQMLKPLPFPRGDSKGKMIGQTTALAIEQSCDLPEGSLLLPAGRPMPDGVAGASLENATPPRSASRDSRIVWALDDVDGHFPLTADTTKGLHGTEHTVAATLDPRAFLYRVRDDTMAPRFNRGEYVLIEPGVAPEIEDEVLVRTTDGQAALARLVSRKGGGYRFGFWGSPATLTLDDSRVSWVYPVAHHIPARRVKA